MSQGESFESDQKNLQDTGGDEVELGSFYFCKKFMFFFRRNFFLFVAILVAVVGTSTVGASYLPDAYFQTKFGISSMTTSDGNTMTFDPATEYYGLGVGVTEIGARLHLRSMSTEAAQTGECSQGFALMTDLDSTGTVTSGDTCRQIGLLMEGDIMPAMMGAIVDVTGGPEVVSQWSIGGPSRWFNDLWVRDLHLGASTVYLDGSAILSKSTGTQLDFTAEVGDKLNITTSGSGVLGLNSDANLELNVSGITTEKDLKLLNASNGGDIVLQTTGVGIVEVLNAEVKLDNNKWVKASGLIGGEVNMFRVNTSNQIEAGADLNVPDNLVMATSSEIQIGGGKIYWDAVNSELVIEVN